MIHHDLIFSLNNANITTLLIRVLNHFRTLFQFEEQVKKVLLSCVCPTWVIYDTLLHIRLSFDLNDFFHGHKTCTKTNKSALCRWVSKLASAEKCFDEVEFTLLLLLLLLHLLLGVMSPPLNAEATQTTML